MVTRDERWALVEASSDLRERTYLTRETTVSLREERMVRIGSSGGPLWVLESDPISNLLIHSLWYGRGRAVLALGSLEGKAILVVCLPLGRESVAEEEVSLLKENTTPSGLRTCGVRIQDGRGSSEGFSSQSGGYGRLDKR